MAVKESSHLLQNLPKAKIKSNRLRWRRFQEHTIESVARLPLRGGVCDPKEQAGQMEIKSVS